ncbi:S1 RNA-binding domain-containing protein [bacterium]
MVKIGKINQLKVVKSVDFGLYLDGGSFGDILLPKRYVPKNCKLGTILNVFIYFDSNDRIIATTQYPFAMVGQVAYLQVVSVSSFGAFVDWGLAKDLLVPKGEQKRPMEKDKYYFVYVYIDKQTNRIVGSAKLNKFIDIDPVEYKEGQGVDIIIYEKTDIGYKAIVDNEYWGILYKNEVFQDLTKGQRIKGFVKKVRPDWKIDLSLYESGYSKVEPLTDKIIAKLEDKNGFIKMNDKTAPEVIYRVFGVSKKAFKAAIGTLYKQRIILIDQDGIKLISKETK